MKLRRENAPDEKVGQAFNDLMNEVSRAMLVVPIHFDEAPEYEDDRVFHCTPLAAKRYNIDSILSRCHTMTEAQMKQQLWPVDQNGLTVDYEWWDVSRISGSDGYRFGYDGPRRMFFPHLSTDGTRDDLVCYTGMDELLKVFGQTKNLHVALFTLNDILELMFRSDQIAGFILNADTETHCFLDKSLFRDPKKQHEDSE